MNAPGAKAAMLQRLRDDGYPVPPFCVVDAHWMADHIARIDPQAPDPVQAVRTADVAHGLRAWLADHAPAGDRFAVRSSAVVEDGRHDSFAGQFGTRLNVRRADLAEAVREVWASAFTPHVLDYAASRGVAKDCLSMGVIVQTMLEPDVSGVAFAVDPVTGRRDTSVVAAVFGLGEGLVSGELDADRYQVDLEGRVDAFVESKPRRRVARASGDTMIQVVPAADRQLATLTDDRAREIAELARRLSRELGAWQDIEWCLRGDALWLLQSRPVTGLERTPDPMAPLLLWDNANIIESYAGVTTPLTFSFVEYVYSQVYPQFFRFMGVEQALIDGNRDLFRMVGLVRGRIYYNLLNWYRALSLLPGYAVNARFMEQMMGVADELDVPVPPVPAGGNRWWRLGRSVAGLLGAWFSLPRRVPAFHKLVDDTLAGSLGSDLHALDVHALVDRYRALESTLLNRWQTPLVNDFFAMVFFGALRKLLGAWCSDLDDEFQNQLLTAEHGIVSTEPVERLQDLVHRCRQVPELARLAVAGDADAFMAHLAQHEDIYSDFEMLRLRFGARTLEELKLETVTAVQEPRLLAQQLIAYLNAGVTRTDDAHCETLRRTAERRFEQCLGANPVKRWVARWVLKHTRRLVAQRENLRFERTRVFDAARRIFLAIGRRLSLEQVLDGERDVFWLTKEELFAFLGGTAVDTDLRAIVVARRAAWAEYETDELPDRFMTRGSPCLTRAFESADEDEGAVEELTEPTLRGTGCCAGVVSGEALVVTDPREVGDLAGRILVAERTDPGWTPLFPVAAGILVERGSLLSHSAIVARELGIPAVVSVRGLLRNVRSGDRVTFDGSTGEVRVERAQLAANGAGS